AVRFLSVFLTAQAMTRRRARAAASEKKQRLGSCSTFVSGIGSDAKSQRARPQGCDPPSRNYRERPRLPMVSAHDAVGLVPHGAGALSADCPCFVRECFSMHPPTTGQEW